MDNNKNNEKNLQKNNNESILNKINQKFNNNKIVNEIIINSEPIERRIAFVTNGKLEKYESEQEPRLLGAIFKGKIQNHEPGLQAVFVDIGCQKNAFLHYWDLLPFKESQNNIDDDSDSSIDSEISNSIDKKIYYNNEKLINHIIDNYPPDKEIIVQIIKAQIGSKGPRITTNIAIPGKYLIINPYSKVCGISRKIIDYKERQRLKNILSSLKSVNDNIGIIIRTAGIGKPKEMFENDLELLKQKWEKINNKIKISKAPIMIERASNMLEIIIRDFLHKNIDKIIVDNKDDYNLILHSIQKIDPLYAKKIILYKENIPIFEKFNIENQINDFFNNRVALPSGGEIILEETEALTAIDVNTGSYKNTNTDITNYIFQANLEASIEILRQIRLRNIGGLIIIDFIDMKTPKDRKNLYNFMQEEIVKDRAKCHILPISCFGIMQMTRQRHSESILHGKYSKCPYCHGKGTIKSPKSVSIEIQRKILNVLKNKRNNNLPGINTTIKLEIYLHPLIMNVIQKNENDIFLNSLEKKYNTNFKFIGIPTIHLESFKIIDV